MSRKSDSLAAAMKPVVRALVEQLELRGLYSTTSVIATTPTPAVDQGQIVQIDFAADGASGTAPSAWTIDWGDGQTSHLGALRSHATHLYGDVGHFTASVSAGGTDGAASLSYTINNVAPEVAIKGRPAGGVEGTPINLSSRVLDLGDPAGRVYGWTLYRDGKHVILPEGTASTGRAFSFTPDDNGAYVARLTVLDGQGGMTTVETRPVLVTNAPPAGTIVGVPHSVIRDGRTIYLSAHATDPGATDTLTYAWTLTHDGDPVTLDDPSTMDQTLVGLADGTYTATCVVTDSDGASTTLAPATFTMRKDLPTTSVSIGVAPTGVEGSSVDAYATVLGPNSGDSDVYAWSVTKDGRPFALPHDVDTTGSSFSFVPDDNAVWTLSVSVADENGIFATAHAGVSVDNAPPAVSVTHVTTGPIEEGHPVRLSTTVTDPGSLDGHWYEWTITKDGVAWTPSIDTRLDTSGLYFTPDDNGTYVATVVAHDFDGGQAIASSAPIVVADAAPHVTIDNAPAAVDEGSPVSLTSTVTDPGVHDTWTYAWSVTKNGRPFAMASSTDYTAPGFAFTPNDNGTYVATLDVTDNDGGHTTQTATINVINVAPVGRISGPVSIDEGTPLTLNAYATDAGTADQLSYAWHATRDGTSVSLSGASDAELDYTPTRPGTYVFTVNISDGDGGVDAVWQTVNVANVDPFVAISGPDGMAGQGDTLTYTSAVIDPGHESHTYAWTVQRNGQDFALPGDVATNNPALSFTALDGGNYVATLTVTDGVGGSMTATSSVTTVIGLLA